MKLQKSASAHNQNEFLMLKIGSRRLEDPPIAALTLARAGSWSGAGPAYAWRVACVRTLAQAPRNPPAWTPQSPLEHVLITICRAPPAGCRAGL